MKLDRAYHIAGIVAAVLIVLPFLLEGWIAMPNWCWTALTAAIFLAIAVWAVLLIARRVRDRKEKEKTMPARKPKHKR